MSHQKSAKRTFQQIRGKPKAADMSEAPPRVCVHCKALSLRTEAVSTISDALMCILTSSAVCCPLCELLLAMACGSQLSLAAHALAFACIGGNIIFGNSMYVLTSFHDLTPVSWRDSCAPILLSRTCFVWFLFKFDGRPLCIFVEFAAFD